MAIPNVMVFLSLTLKAITNRWVNIIAGLVSIVVLGATFFVGELSARYMLQSLIEGVVLALIIWHAWKWPKQQSVEIRPKTGRDREISSSCGIKGNYEEALESTPDNAMTL